MSEVAVIFQPERQLVSKFAGQVGSGGAEDNRVCVVRDIFRKEVDLGDNIAVAGEDRFKVGCGGTVVGAETGENSNVDRVGVGQVHDRTGHGLLSRRGLDRTVLLIDIKQIVSRKGLVTFAALQKDLTVGELYIRVLCGKINIRVDVNVRDVDLVGVLGVFIDNGICLFVVVVVVFVVVVFSATTFKI